MNYRPLIEDMTWSYSRITTFTDCPYRFYLKYIKGFKEADKFYATYGTLMHTLNEQYYKGELHPRDMPTEFLTRFKTEVKGERPPGNTVENYIQKGLAYCNSFTPFPFNTVGIEKHVRFSLGKHTFQGYIDYLGERNGDLYIVDNKSRELKPRSGKPKPTNYDRTLDDMLKQLYIYSAAVKSEYGVFPKALCFNCFKNQAFIEEPFNENAYNATVEWAEGEIEKIKDANEFQAQPDYFVCRWICGVSKLCEYAE